MRLAHLPYTSQIEFGETERLIQEVVRPGWDRFVGFSWEEWARQHVQQLAARAATDPRLVLLTPDDVVSAS